MPYMSYRTLIIVLLFMFTGSAAAELYIRNKPVEAKSPRLAAYVPQEALSTYFTPGELERCQFDLESGEIRVDGALISERLGPDPEASVPVIALAVALGFEKRENRQLGIVDYVTPATLEGKKPRADVPLRKGAEYHAAEARMTKILRKTPRLSAHPDLERVERIGQELAAVSDMPGLQWNFLIVSESSPNAFCTGVGWVGVTEGMLALKLSNDELAGVLAHEIGHGCRRDLEEQRYNLGAAGKLKNEGLRLRAEWEELTRRQEELWAKAERARRMAGQMVHASNVMEMRNEAAEADRAAENLTRPIRNLEREIKQKQATENAHTSFATASVFKHQDEIDADIKGLRYASLAGYSVQGLMSALQKLAAHNSESFGQAAYQGGLNHPPLATRINTMRKVLADWRQR